MWIATDRIFHRHKLLGAYLLGQMPDKTKNLNIMRQEPRPSNYSVACHITCGQKNAIELLFFVY